MSSEKKLTKKDYLKCFGISVLIAVTYVMWLGIIVDWIEEGKISFNLLPEASGQIQPFELQLEQIRNPADCTRKVIQGSSAIIPFQMKIFYDTTRDSELKFKQQATTFPVIQRTNQVMTFYTNGTDQYEIYMELNYDEAKPRQIFMEYLSSNNVVLNMQEKFEEDKFCMTIFVNTILPTTIPTKEEIFGESLDYIAEIPSMVRAFNANTITTGTSISFQWLLLFGILIVSILTFISSSTGKRRFDARIHDLDDTISEANKMTMQMDDLNKTVTETLRYVKKNFELILRNFETISQIKLSVPEKKESKFRKILPFRKKKDELMTEAEVVALAEENPKSESEEVAEELESDQIRSEIPDQTPETRPEPEPSGGFVLIEKETKQEPKEEQPKEGNPMRLKPPIFDEILNGIDLKRLAFKEGEFDRFSYNELNESYGWIVKYRKWMESQERDIPNTTYAKQKIIEDIIYRAIFAKMEKHQVQTQKETQTQKEDEEKDD